MNQVLSHNYTGKSLVIVCRVNGKAVTRIGQQNHANWNKILEAYKANKYAEAFDLFDVAVSIAKQFDGKFTVRDNKVYYDGNELRGYLVDRILYCMQYKPDEYKRLIKFAERLYTNPDKHVLNELHKFLEHKHMPITEDGSFLAYKGVKDDYYSITSGNIKLLKGKVNSSGQVYNGVGEEIIAERKDVCANSGQGCAQGLHAGS